MNFDLTSLGLGLLFGCVGMGYFMYGKSEANYMVMGVGGALMIVPYFFSSNLLMCIVCGAIAAVPLFVKES
jgi:small ligand-binding sensory domain FIST